MKLTKKSILIALAVMFSLTLALYVISLIPSPLEAKALQQLDLKVEWQEQDDKRTALTKQYEADLKVIVDRMLEIESDGATLEAEINTEITGLGQVQ